MNQAELEKNNKNWLSYLILVAMGLIFIVAPIAAMFYFREEIKQAQAYGYLGVFFIGVLCGISVIPAPTQILIFTFGRILDPVWVGFIAGFGGAVGGITVYLTGTGVETIWAKLRHNEVAFEARLGLSGGLPKKTQSKLMLNVGKFYDRMVGWVGGTGGAWALFITSSLPISPFYAAGLAAGSLKMGLVRFFLISWAGKTVRSFILAFGGYWGLQFISKWIGI